MTREDIIKLAKECGNWSGQAVEMNDVGLERFAKLVAAAERSACAKVCDAEADEMTEGEWTSCAIYLANNIRARGEKK